MKVVVVFNIIVVVFVVVLESPPLMSIRSIFNWFPNCMPCN